MMAPVDKRALRILFDTYWTATGWRKQPATSAEDLAYAKSVGVMFEPVLVTHNEAVDWALGCREIVSKEAVVAGFLASLSSRRLDLRSALGSFAVLRNFPSHRWSRTEGPGYSCPVCGAYEGTASREDLNVLNFERFKWGGVRHSTPLFIAFDLERFAKIEMPCPADNDRAILREIIQTAASMPKGSRLSDLAKALAPVLPSNNPERRTLIGILGYCGILRDPLKPGYFEGFPKHLLRPSTPWAKDDWPYPVQWWNSSHGVQFDALSEWFPQLM
jgi:hypothetical protein